jgi:hypothetical protein
MTAVINISPFNLHQTITLDNGEIIMCRMDEITSFAQKLIDEGAVTNFKVAGPEVFTQKIAKEISNIKPTKFNYISILYEKKGNLWESI